jgi:hypothetical protein
MLLAFQTGKSGFFLEFDLWRLLHGRHYARKVDLVSKHLTISVEVIGRGWGAQNLFVCS